MEKGLLPDVNVERGQMEISPVAELRVWKMKMKQLLWEADYAIRNGQWTKAQDLLAMVRKMSKEREDTLVTK